MIATSGKGAFVNVVYVCHKTVINKTTDVFIALFWMEQKFEHPMWHEALFAHHKKTSNPQGLNCVDWSSSLVIPPRPPRQHTSSRIQSVPYHYILSFYPVHSVSPINALHQSNLHNRFNNAPLSKCSLANVVGWTKCFSSFNELR